MSPWSKEKRREHLRNRRQTLRTEGLVAYGGVCVSCGEGDMEVLVLDHINDGGRQHLRQTGGTTETLYRALRQAGWPDGIVQVLCANCNMRKERKRRALAHESKQKHPELRRPK